jgi:predicted dehydrogenase
MLSPEIDAIVIATPDDLHACYANAAMRAGKAVLCEKPMAINLADCDSMLLCQRETHAPFKIGFNLRHHPMYQRMREIAESGELGSIRSVWVRHFVGMGGNYYFQDWHGLRSRANTLLLQKGTHDIDIIHYVTGFYSKRVMAIGNRSYFGGDQPDDLTCQECPEQFSCPESAYQADLVRSQCAFRREIDIEDNEILLMELENGALVSYTQCQFTPDYHRSYTFIGTKGRMECFEPQTRRNGWQNDHRIEILFRGAKTRRTECFQLDAGGHGGADARMLHSWLDDLVANRYNESNPVAGRQSVAVGCLGAESLRGVNDWKDVPPLPYS